MDRDSQIKAIEKTFEDNKKPIEKHYSKPGVVPVEVLPVFPDFMLWKYPCAQVIFDSDPAPQDKPISAQIEQMSQAMIRYYKLHTHFIEKELKLTFIIYFCNIEVLWMKVANNLLHISYRLMKL